VAPLSVPMKIISLICERIKLRSLTAKARFIGLLYIRRAHLDTAPERGLQAASMFKPK
jgi:hypothetical protein